VRIACHIIAEMQPIPPGSGAPGPSLARGWQIGLGCVAALSLVTGSVAGLVILAWAIYRHEPSVAFSFPNIALVGFVPPLVSIVAGVWTWRSHKVWRFASATAIFSGVMGIGFAAMDVFVFVSS